ncbi:galactose-3-O-sulfotransferase 3 [Tiliqua scincoides]|uniref:galactose-3-O-sulfotransferase 3 n=1 Tax=Tiliqua scincoides TaxID=71010 RepID=UPI0034618110
MTCTLSSLLPGPKMMSPKKAVLFLLAFSTGTLLLRQSAHLSWFPKPPLFSCPPLLPSRSKHTAVAFLKTHKTASTTVQNLLFRFAERHNLTVALPHHPCDHQFCYPRNFSGHFVHPYTLPPRFIASHLRFNRAELRRLMPNDTIYVTILREPVAMFESLFSYYNQYCSAFKRVPNSSMEAFLENPLQYYRPNEKYAMYARNTLVYDLGGDPEHSPDDPTYLPQFIRQVESIFSLVMLAEYFDESLVLLRRLLAWDLNDILYVKLNMRSLESKLNVSSPRLASQIRSWNALDARLYDHFNATFWRKLSQVGQDCVEKEVHALRKACERLARHCFGGQPQLRPAMQIKNKDLRPWQPSAKVGIVGYDLPGSGPPLDEQCLKLIMPEVQYSRYLLRKQSMRNRRRAALHRSLPPQGLLRPPRHLAPKGAGENGWRQDPSPLPCGMTTSIGLMRGKRLKASSIASPPLSSTKTQAAELGMAWTQLCMRESRARIRNQQLLQNFSGLEAQLARLAAKTDALRRRRKRDYEDLLQHLQRDLWGHQGPTLPPGWVYDKPLELQAGPPSAPRNIANVVASNGPVTALINTKGLQNYQKGIIRNQQDCSVKYLNHVVTIVGFDTVRHRRGSRHGPYWIIQNSWGEHWGEEGYFRLHRGINACGIAMYAATAIVRNSGGKKPLVCFP